jgi:hypothetical protein
VLSFTGKLDEGLAQYRRNVEINPTFTETAFKVGLAYLYQGKYSLAEASVNGLYASRNPRDKALAAGVLGEIEVGRGGESVSSEKNDQRDFLKLYAYSTLANFMVTLSSRGEVDEDEARSMLRIQNELIQQFDSTLAAQLDQASMQSFRDFVNKYRVRMG